MKMWADPERCKARRWKKRHNATLERMKLFIQRLLKILTRWLLVC